MNPEIANLRKDYALNSLTESEADCDPFKQFQIWFDHAVAAGLPEPNAMTLATVTSDGLPNARMVLLKGIDDQGFRFYTNYESQKGQDLAHNPHAALVFWWGTLERQIRIQGRVEKLSDGESDRYFHSRPFGSQVGALVSQQSQVIPNRDVLEQRLEELTQKYIGQTISRPPYWGGYRVIPHTIEFWQGRPSRLHDRLRYRLQADQSWKIDRLSP